MKLISKARACCLKNIISSIINENQVAYVDNKFVSEDQYQVFLRLLVLQILKFFLMTVDKEETFNSINHSFFCVFKKNGFASEFIKWIKILMKNPEQCVVNDGKAKPFFKLETN